MTESALTAIIIVQVLSHVHEAGHHGQGTFSSPAAREYSPKVFPSFPVDAAGLPRKTEQPAGMRDKKHGSMNMEKILPVTIWDHDVRRIYEIEKNLRNVLKSMNIQGQISIMSEPPLLARTGVLHQIPLLEIQGKFWGTTPGRSISEQDILALLNIIKP